jgi:hypothetical protein
MTIDGFARAKHDEILRYQAREKAYKLGEAAIEAATEQDRIETDRGIRRTPFIELDDSRLRNPLAIRELGSNYLLMVKIDEHNTANYARVRPGEVEHGIEYDVEPDSLVDADNEVVRAFTGLVQAMGVDLDALEPIAESVAVTDTFDLAKFK